MKINSLQLKIPQIQLKQVFLLSQEVYIWHGVETVEKHLLIWTALTQKVETELAVTFIVV